MVILQYLGCITNTKNILIFGGNISSSGCCGGYLSFVEDNVLSQEGIIQLIYWDYVNSNNKILTAKDCLRLISGDKILINNPQVGNCFIIIGGAKFSFEYFIRWDLS